MKIKATCPNCGYEVDDASGIGDAEKDRPGDGDVALCIRCAFAGFYMVNPDGQTLGIRVPTEDEKVGLSEDAQLVAYQERIRSADLMRWFVA
jgi:hypothetical protein